MPERNKTSVFTKVFTTSADNIYVEEIIMSLIEDLKKEIDILDYDLEPFESARLPMNLYCNIVSGKYGTEIMLDYLDYLGGDSVEFVRKQQEKGIQRKD